MTRSGFIIPNAALVAPDYQAAQPDQGDFLLLGNEQFGVVFGCKVALSFPTVSLTTVGEPTTAHTLVCKGEIFLLSGAATASLAVRGAQARLDLVVFDSQNGGFKVVSGTPADNPVFPDITSSMVVLAAVSVPSTSSPATPTLIDKRVLLPVVQVSDSTSASIIRTYDVSTSPPTQVFNIDGHGKLTWGTQTALEQLSPGIIKITSELDVDTIVADTIFLGGVALHADSRISWGSSLPGSGTTGDIWVSNLTGDIYVWQATAWVLVGTSTPSGSVIMSFLAPASMAGWLPLLGQTVAVGAAGNLPTLFPAWVSGGNITLPDMRGRLPVGGGYVSSSAPGFVNGTNPSGTVVDDHGTVSTSIAISNLPAHKHRTSDVTNVDGVHQHAIPIWAPFQPTGGVVSNTGSANTNGVTIDSLTSTTFDGQHGHGLPPHNAVGGNQPLQVTPPTLGLHFYIKL